MLPLNGVILGLGGYLNAQAQAADAKYKNAQLAQQQALQDEVTRMNIDNMQRQQAEADRQLAQETNPHPELWTTNPQTDPDARARALVGEIGAMVGPTGPFLGTPDPKSAYRWSGSGEALVGLGTPYVAENPAWSGATPEALAKWNALTPEQKNAQPELYPWNAPAHTLLAKMQEINSLGAQRVGPDNPTGNAPMSATAPAPIPVPNYAAYPTYSPETQALALKTWPGYQSEQPKTFEYQLGDGTSVPITVPSWMTSGQAANYISGIIAQRGSYAKTQLTTNTNITLREMQSKSAQAVADTNATRRSLGDSAGKPLSINSIYAVQDRIDKNRYQAAANDQYADQVEKGYTDPQGNIHPPDAVGAQNLRDNATALRAGAAEFEAKIAAAGGLPGNMGGGNTQVFMAPGSVPGGVNPPVTYRESPLWSDPTKNPPPVQLPADVVNAAVLMQQKTPTIAGWNIVAVDTWNKNVRLWRKNPSIDPVDETIADIQHWIP